MQISAKATFLGFAQALDPHTGRLEIAGVEIFLAHTAGASAGDVLQVDAVRDNEGAWSGVVTARLAPPEIDRSRVLAASASEPAHQQAPHVPLQPPAPVSIHAEPPSRAHVGAPVARARRFADATSAMQSAPPRPAQAAEALPAGPVDAAAPAKADAAAPARAPVRRFGVSSAAHRAVPAPARPRFTPCAGDERVSY